ncbi:MAG: hypothetical protein J6T16_05410 [Opitutales bacterium]|nr:hypothetical protein [Opitutales bacterium]
MTDKTSNPGAQDAPDAAESEAVLKELRRAYKEISDLKNSPSHRKIVIDLEAKFAREKKRQPGKKSL